MPETLPFPLVRQRGLVQCLAASLAGLSGKSAEALLYAALQRQRDALLACDVEPREVEREVRAFSTAVVSAAAHAPESPEAAHG